MKQLIKDLAAVLKTLNTLTQKVQNMQKLVDKPEKIKKTKAPKAKAKPVKKVAKKVAVKPAKKSTKKTAYDTLLANIDKKGISVKDLKSKTGFDSKKITNLLYKAKKDGKIKSEKKGFYAKV